MTHRANITVNDLKASIYYFLKHGCQIMYEADGDVNLSGNMIDNSMYLMRCKEEAMDQLAYDMGIEVAEGGETAWEAIKRHMEKKDNEI